MDAGSQLKCVVVPSSYPFVSTATMGTARGSAWKSALACFASRWLVAVEAVEICDNKAPVFEVFSVIPLIFSTMTVAKLVFLVAVAKLVLPPNAFWEEVS